MIVQRDIPYERKWSIGMVCDGLSGSVYDRRSESLSKKLVDTASEATYAQDCASFFKARNKVGGVARRRLLTLPHVV